MKKPALLVLAAALFVSGLAFGVTKVLGVNTVDQPQAFTSTVAVTGAVTCGSTLTCTGAISTGGDVTLAGGDITCSKTDQTLNIVSATAATTMDGTVPAILLKASATPAADDRVWCAGYGTTKLICQDKEGDLGVVGRMSSVETVTVADSGNGSAATATLNPTANVVLLVCNDTDGCTVTMGETGAVEGTLVTIVATTANASAFADTSGVSETTGALSLGIHDSLQLVYANARWVEVALSNN